MPKNIRALICLVLLATAIGTVAAQDDAICQALRAMHASQGDSLAAYLSAKGMQCLVPASTPTRVPTATLSEKIWSERGRGEAQRSISVKMTRGLYDFEAPKPIAGVGKYAQLEAIVSVPSTCFPWESVVFPSTVRVEHDCTIHGTLSVELGIFPDRSKWWEFVITRISNELPPVPAADGWTVSGSGHALYPVEVVFTPGIYRIEQRRGPDTTWLFFKTSSPQNCFGILRISVPTQREVKRRCRIKASLAIGYPHEAVSSWSYRITKLD